MTEFEKMQAGQDFDGFDPEISAIRDRAFELMQQINRVPIGKADAQLAELFGSLGPEVYIAPPFHCEFGKTIHIGHNCFFNMNITMLDNARIDIGNHVLIGPNCQFYTPSHDMDYRERRLWKTHSQPIRVEDDVWIGGNVVITQGVTIGARSVIAAGSVVTRDVPPDSLYGGSPARLLRDLS